MKVNLNIFLIFLFFGYIFSPHEVNAQQKLIRDCEICPTMVVIEPGRFIKGSPETDAGSRDDERPQHQVEINYNFAIGRHEVTRGEYGSFVKSTGHNSIGGCYGATDNGIQLGIELNWYDPGYPVGDNYPVVCVSWNEAMSYAQWLSKETGENYRLLSESEWEYSARAGTRTIRFWGDSDEGCDYANGADLDITPESFLEEMKGRGTKIVLPEDWVVADCHDGYE
ncbi:MAG: SUMF1/EgtB/PvdO family nonheme iron enzyme, partial [Porticoccaceae bacterium]|nr:SUMF1/EgtB/PvdO family nonheme iron enzyme [Porticoccaceae bacterium]